MRIAGGFPRLAAALLCLALAACSSTLSTLGVRQPQGEPMHVLEARQLQVCNSDGPQARVSLLADPEAVRAWQHAHNVDVVGVDPLPTAGPYVMVEMGVRLSGGYAIAISREAQLDQGTARLSASLLTPAPDAMTTQAVTSPCVLVALPPGAYRAVELRDPAGTLLAKADGVAPVQ